MAEVFELVERGGKADDLDGDEFRGRVKEGLDRIGIVDGDGVIVMEARGGLSVDDRGSFELEC